MSYSKGFHGLKQSFKYDKYMKKWIEDTKQHPTTFFFYNLHSNASTSEFCPAGNI